MADPLIPQGRLNRLRASVSVILLPQLNVMVSNLGKGGISIAPEGDATVRIPTMTGAVVSPEPYRLATATIHLLRTQNLANLWRQQEELDSVIGSVVITTDAKTLRPYNMLNCSIQTISELGLNGEDPGYVITVGGYFPINSALWNLA